MHRRGERAGQVRACVPLFRTDFTSLGPGQRLAITRGAVLAGLDHAEQQRIQDDAGARAVCRVEFHGVLPDFRHCGPRDLATTQEAWDYKERNAPLGKRLATQVALLSLTQRVHPNHESVLADVWNGEYWVRIGPIQFTYSAWNHLTTSIFTTTRLPTWGALIEHWPAEPTGQLDFALDLYLDSVRERQRQALRAAPVDKAMLSAAVALEVLLGYHSPNELSKTIAQRCAHLVAAGDDAHDVFRVVKKLYGVRSKLVHEGKATDTRSLTLLQQLFMAVLPAVASAHPMTRHDELTTALDLANFTKVAMISQIRSSQWAQYVPIADLCRAYLKG